MIGRVIGRASQLSDSVQASHGRTDGLTKKYSPWGYLSTKSRAGADDKCLISATTNYRQSATSSTCAIPSERTTVAAMPYVPGSSQVRQGGKP